ncbi:MAG: bifunctional hydroxymethylpyrimidine kinase/phosphomethylpyrimidine kinase [Candidatus Hydrothermarchaeales archaeon]
MQRGLPVALTIAGSDSGGGAGIQADLKTFAAHEVHGVCVITSLTAQNTLSVEDVFDIPPKFIEAQFRAIHDDFDVKAAKTGMLSNGEIIKTVAEMVGDYPLVVDPVMIAESGGELLQKDALEILKKELFPKATLLTPNIHEAEILSGLKIEDAGDMKKACEIIADYGPSVIVKGGHLDATDILYHKGKFYEFKAEKIGEAVHGSGCTFAAAIVSNIAKGGDLIVAIEEAKGFIISAIRNAHRPGTGLKVADQFAGIIGGYERHRVVEELRNVLEEIKELDHFSELIPEVGVNLVYALSNASTIEDVAGVKGRIVKIGDRVKVVGGVEFGASRHIARAVLTAMGSEPMVRSGMNIRYSRELIDACKGLFSVSTFSREDEPEGVETMEWGTAEAINVAGKVPDIIYDLGAIGKEPMIRVLGRDPQDVLGKLKKLLLALK